MRNTEAWWVCDKCGLPTVRTGKNRGAKQAMLEHRKTCHPIACFSIKQVEQGKGARAVDAADLESQ